jgi:hypothetical protein
MLRMLPGFVLAVVAGLGAASAVSADPPAPPPPAAARSVEAPPPIVDLTPGDLPERQHGSSPIDCITCNTCNNTPPTILASAEYILFRARRRANDYAIADPNNNLTPEGVIRNVPYETDSGFRGTLGYRPGGSPWEFLFTYTYFRNGNDRETVAPPGGLLYPTLTRPGIVDDAQFAVGSASLTLSVYDLESMRHFTIDEAFTLKFGMGARYADMDQTLQAAYFGGTANAAGVRSRVSFTGAGVTVGGQGDWVFWRNLRFFGRGRASLLMSDFDNTLVETNNGGQTVNVNVTESYRQVVPVLELASGVAWEYRNVRLAVGYEIANWFNVVDSPTFIDDFSEGTLGRRQSDLGIEGVFAQLGLVF